MTTKYRYGWVPDRPDQRDQIFLAPKIALPTHIDLRPLCPAVYDQGQLGSCTANAIAAAHEFDQMRQKFGNPFTPSRLFIYYNERVMENTVSSDSGAMIRDGIKSINTLGAGPESTWPYDIAKFSKKPSAKVYAQAKAFESVTYQSITPTVENLKACLSGGIPFVFGFTVYESFESAQVAASGIVPMPAKKEKTLGGHAVMAVGYDDTVQRFIVRNSWGASWGQEGYFEIPYAYLTGPLASDFWCINLIK